MTMIQRLTRWLAPPSPRKRRPLSSVETRVQRLEVRNLLSATTTPTSRLNTQDKIARHEAIHLQVDAGDADVIFIGDSITQRWDDQGSDAFAQYFGDYDTINMGIGGDATQSVLWRLQDYDLSNIAPEVAVLLVGTNNLCWPSRGECTGHDSASDTADGVEANVDYLRQALPNTHVLLLGLFPRGQYATNELRQPVTDTNQQISTLDDDEYVHYMDIGNLLLESNGEISSDIMFDYLHLTEDGYNVVAAAIEPTIESLVDGFETPIVIEGTEGDDTFRFIAGENDYQVSFNGQLQTFQTPVNIHFNGNGGSDVVRLEGNDGDDTVTLSLNSVFLAGDGYVISANDVEFKTVVGGGGNDKASLFDSNGDDRFIAKPNLGYITGPNLYSVAAGFENITAFASDGFDLADLFDSSGDDVVVNHPKEVNLQNADGDFSNTARSFNYVRSTAVSGGFDQANFYDSAADDYFVARPDDAYMRDKDSSYFNFVRGFDAKRAFAVAGGSDDAQFYDAVDDDYFISKPTHSYMQNKTGDYFYNYAAGFERSLAYSVNGGYDEAQFYDSADSDRLQAKTTYAYIYSQSYLNFGKGFSKVVAIGNGGGHDRLDQQRGLMYAFYRFNEWEEIHSI